MVGRLGHAIIQAPGLSTMPGPTMSLNTAPGVSYDDADHETVPEAEAQLKEAQDLVAAIDRLDASCQSSRHTVQAAANRLISQIREHEQRLLEEIDVHHQTELKKVPVDPGTLRDITARLEKLQNEKTPRLGSLGNGQLEEKRLSLDEAGSDTDSSLGLDSVIRLVAVTEQQLSPGELVLSEMSGCPHGMLGWLAGYEMQEIRCVTFVPIRCNTAFGSVEAEGGSPAPEAGQRSRSISLLGPNSSPCDLRAPSPERSSSLCRTRSLRVSRSSSPRHGSTYPADHLSLMESPWEGGLSRLRRHHSMKVPKDMNRLSTRHAWSPLSMRRAGSGASSCPSSTHHSPVRGDCPETFSLLWQLTDTDRFNSPTDVVFLPGGDLAVADRDNERVQVISWKKGTIVRSIGQGKIRPQRLAITPDNHLAVTDLKSGCVKIFSLDGRAVSSWGRKRFKSTFQSPCGLAINSRGQYIVSDMAKQSVSVHQPDGKLLHLLGAPTGEFHSPAYVAAARADRVVVADNWNNTVKVFDGGGEVLFQLDDHDEVSRLDYPNGVCVDDAGDVLVAEWGKHRVSRYTGNGRFVRHLLTRDEGIHYPAGIAARGDLLAETEYSDTHSVVRLFQINKRQL